MPIDSINMQNASLFNAPGAGGPAEAGSGVFMGIQVSRSDSPESLLADAAEELTFSVDNTEECELKDRKEEDRTKKMNLERVRMYQEMMHEAGQAPQIDKLKDSIRAWARNKASGEVSRLLSDARGIFPDVSDAWAALKECAEAPSFDGETRDALARAADELEQREGAAVYAGIQGALSSAGFDDLGTPGEMRSLYRRTVCDFSSPDDVFAMVQKEYGDGGFDRAMDFLFSALSSDIASDRPSMGSRHLENVHGNLEKVRLTRSAYILCENMEQRWEKVHGVKDSGLDAMAMLGGLLEICRNSYPGAMHFEALLAKASAPDIEREVLFLQEALDLVRKFPDGIFSGEEGRIRVLDAAQAAVDAAVQREAGYLAGLE